MAHIPKSPQEKKRLSLQKDRRNTYGENDKGSRKAIPRAKAKSRRAVRKTAKDDLHKLISAADAEADAMESTLSTPRLQKGAWRKSPDTPLGEVVKRKLKRRADDVGARQRRRARQKADTGL